MPERWDRTTAPAAPLFVSFNVMSLRTAYRELEILFCLAMSAFLCLQGTRIPHPAKNTAGFTYIEQSGFHCFHFGYVPGGNKHAGLEICVNSKHFGKNNISEIYAPTDKILQGRIAAVRVRTNTADVTIVNVYLPPSFEQHKKIYQHILEALNTFLKSLPARTLPILCGDLNARFGIQRNAVGGSEWPASRTVGRVPSV